MAFIFTKLAGVVGIYIGDEFKLDGYPDIILAIATIGG